MQWSKLKKSSELFICEVLKGRIEYFITWYRDSGNDKIGRATILFDGKEIFEADTWKYIFQTNEFEKLDFINALEDYINLSIDEALSSDNPIIRGLSMIDRRLGKRKLCLLRLSENEHEFVKFMFKLRIDSEEIKI